MPKPGPKTLHRQRHYTAIMMRRQQRVKDLWIAGCTYREIQDQCNRDVFDKDGKLIFPATYLARGTVANDIAAIKRQWREENAKDIAERVDEQDQMLVRLHRAVWPRAMNGDPQAAKIVLSIAERRAKLLGLDAPTKTSLTNPAGDGIAHIVIEYGDGNDAVPH